MPPPPTHTHRIFEPSESGSEQVVSVVLETNFCVH